MGDFYHLCRLCLKNSHLYCNIFEECFMENYIVHEVINFVYELDVSLNDGLPKFVCIECLSKVKDFMTLKQEAHNGRSALILLKYNLENDGVAEIQASSYCSVDVGGLSLKTEEMSEDFPLTEVFIKVEPETDKLFESQASKSSPTNSKGASSNAGGISSDLGFTGTTIKEEVLEIENEAEDSIDNFAGIDQGPSTSAAWKDDEEDPLAEEHKGLPVTVATEEPSPAGSDMTLKIKEIIKDLTSKKRPEARDETSYHCARCAKVFKYKKGFVTHLQTHARDKNFQCAHCEEGFDEKTRLKEHLKARACGYAYRCRSCGKRFEMKSDLDTHSCKDRPFVCHVCGSRFSQRSGLNIHFRVHTGDKPFKCESCDKRFNQRSTLNVHKRVHSGEKPYQCDVCLRMFSHKNSLTTHSRTHSGEQPFACEICRKRFTYKNCLDLHLITHTDGHPYACHLCPKRYKFKSSLDNHLSAHNDPKPFECQFCSKRYREKRSLVNHLSAHAGYTPYECESCLKKFVSEKSLIRHSKIHKRD